MDPLTGQARLQVAQLRDFDLQFTLQRVRALCEYIQYELRAIDDADLEFVLQIARLRRAERIIKNCERRPAHTRQLAHLGGFAAADEGPGIDRFKLLLNLAGDFCSRTLGECAEFGKRVVAGNSVGSADLYAHQDSPFGIVDAGDRSLTQKPTSLPSLSYFSKSASFS